MTGPDQTRDPGWDAGWDAHALAQARRLARLPLAEKLRWLEEAQTLVEHLHGAPGKGVVRDAGTSEDDGRRDGGAPGDGAPSRAR